MRDTLKCYKIDPAQAPVIDGSMADWSESYKVGTFDSPNNIFAVHNWDGWPASWKDGFTTDYCADLYLCHTDTFLYIAWKTTVDDVLRKGHDWTQGADKLWLAWNGSNRIFIYDDVLVPDSNPFFDGGFNTGWIPNVKIAVHPGTGGIDLPVYEIRLNKSQIGKKQVILGYIAEDVDNSGVNDNSILGIGCQYTGDKGGEAWHVSPSPWMSNLNYPVTLFVDSLPVAIESRRLEPGSGKLSVFPTPFTRVTSFAYRLSAAHADAMIAIYNMDGRCIKSFPVRQTQGRINWNAAGTSPGVYVARLRSGNGFAASQKLILMN